ncbi:MAG: recombination mediator RecR [Planctomycetota bacterium]
MKELAEPLARLAAELERLPGVGARTAERLAYHLLKVDREEAMRLARAIRDVKESLKACRVCSNIADADLCRICRSSSRDRSRICVVEQVRDLVAIEKTGAYDGLYHVLLGRVAPNRGEGPQDTTLGALLARLDGEEKERVKEVIVATNPDAEGDTTALVVAQELASRPVTVTRLARGIPSGGSIEFANVEILRDAFRGRS